MAPEELLRRLVEAADDVGSIAAPAPVRAQLTALCATTRRSLGAAAVSIARTTDEVLVYEASSGEGAEEIVGVELSLGEGLAGYVARTGQAMVVDQVQSDPRFAHDVAQSTGYVPTSMLVAPVVADSGEVIGVVSVLDRADTGAGADALEIATLVAAQAALLLPAVDALTRLGPLLLEAVANAVGEDLDLADALRDLATGSPADDVRGELATHLALLAELRTMNPQARATVERVLGDLLDLARPRRR